MFKRLESQAPEAFCVLKGDTPVIIAGPHNGSFVPKSLYKDGQPLGLHRSCYKFTSPFRRHEVCDWGIKQLFDALQRRDLKTGQKHNYISSPYSRLVCDLSRGEDEAITEVSSENGSPIPGNIGLGDAQKKERLERFYKPFWQAQERLIQDVQSKFGYAVFLDLHSFTPKWNGTRRQVHMGTLACSEHYIETFLAKYMRETCRSKGLRFCKDRPYNLKKMPAHRSVTARRIESLGVLYTGFEVRNDLLIYPNQVKKIARLIQDAMTALLQNEQNIAVIHHGQNTHRA